tara:strand:- start:43 stop:513 length:471 start_codon:yes stop_codon:yes gene_type:complete
MSGIVGQVGARSGVVGSTIDGTQLDYEEGTFTPTFLTGGVAASTLGSVYGFYIKIGKFVSVFIEINITSGGGSGNITVSGLPFTSRSSSGFVTTGVIVTSNIDASAEMPYIAELSNGSTTCAMRTLRKAQSGSYNSMTISNIGNSSKLSFSLTYRT